MPAMDSLVQNGAGAMLLEPTFTRCPEMPRAPSTWCSSAPRAPRALASTRTWATASGPIRSSSNGPSPCHRCHYKDGGAHAAVTLSHDQRRVMQHYAVDPQRLEFAVFPLAPHPGAPLAVSSATKGTRMISAHYALHSGCRLGDQGGRQRWSGQTKEVYITTLDRGSEHRAISIRFNAADPLGLGSGRIDIPRQQRRRILPPCRNGPFLRTNGRSGSRHRSGVASKIRCTVPLLASPGARSTSTARR